MDFNTATAMVTHKQADLRADSVKLANGRAARAAKRNRIERLSAGVVRRLTSRSVPATGHGDVRGTTQVAA